MEDLNQQLQQILSDPQSFQQIRDMAAALGLGAAPTPQEPPAPAAAQSAAAAAPDALFLAGKLAPLLSLLSREDDSIRLLQALRPLLSPPRQQKLDEAMKLLQIMRLLPLLRESGLF